MWRSSLIQSHSSSLLVLVLILVVVSITTSQTSSKAQYSQDGKELRQDDHGHAYEYEGMNRTSNAKLLKLKAWPPKAGRQKRLRPPISHLPSSISKTLARVVKWQTRTFEGRMPKGMRVKVPPLAQLPPASARPFQRHPFVIRLSSVMP